MDSKKVEGVRVLARELARELTMEEVVHVTGGIVRPPVGTHNGTGTHNPRLPDMDIGPDEDQ